jgi:hypothetical protein
LTIDHLFWQARRGKVPVNRDNDIIIDNKMNILWRSEPAAKPAAELSSDSKTRAARLGAQTLFRQQFALYFSDEIAVAEKVGIAVSIFIGLVYVRTMYPSGISTLNDSKCACLNYFRAVPGGDSGELIVVGCTTGIAHPPGD